MAGLEIRLLGELRVLREGTILPLPRSKKTRALLAYLALQGAPQRRDDLCEIFWDAPDDPRGALRWSLAKLRPLVNDESLERLAADRERVSFVRGGAAVDLLDAEAAMDDGIDAMDAGELARLEALFAGRALAGMELPRHPAFESWRMSQEERARSLHLRLLDARLRRADNPGAEIAILRRRLEVGPEDEAVHVALVEALKRSGDVPGAERQAELSGRTLGAIADGGEASFRARLRAAGGRTAEGAAPAAKPLRQDVRYCAARDGVRIAYASVGEGPPLVKAANWLNHLEFDWESPIWRGLFLRLSSRRTLVRYDARGSGLSDWDAEDLSLPAYVDDLEAVVDATGLKRFPIFARSQGCCTAVAYAARNPERVSRLILLGGYAHGWRLSSSPKVIAQYEAVKGLLINGWGGDVAAFRQMFTSLLQSRASPNELEWFDAIQRATTSGANSARLLESMGRLDVRDLLGDVRAPTLVLHSRGDRFIPVKRGQELAAGIRGSRFVGLASDNHMINEDEPAFERLIEEIEAFLAEAG
jgi:pimeloyl-ACP methyl ester carboxylesterase/DNA-binding SARP family transcriptional activator